MLTSSLRIFLFGALACWGCTASAGEYYGDRVWEDLDGDGRQDSNEPGIPGVTMQLWNTARTQLLRQSVTDLNGRYILVAPTPGNYRIKCVLRYPQDRITLRDAVPDDDEVDSDFNNSGTLLGFTGIILQTDDSTTGIYDVGLISDPMKDNTIGGQTFYTLADGTQATRILGSVPVELLNPAGVVLQMTTSNSLGYYGFKAPPGDYRVRFYPPSYVCPSPHPNAGTDDTIDSDIDEDSITGLLVLGAGQVLREVDAGFVTRVLVGDFVWSDADGDGVQDAGEAGLPGVTVELWNAAKTKVWDATTSRADGSYSLYAPGPGEYRVFALRPLATDTFSPRAAGSEPTKDSCIYSTDANYGFSDIVTVDPNLLTTISWDVGITLASGTRTITPLAITGLEVGASLGSVKLSFTGQRNGTFSIDRSSDLKTWTEAIAPFVSPASANSRTVTFPPNSPRQFFRLNRLR